MCSAVERRIDILEYLNVHRFTVTRELTEEYSVSRKTIYRDIMYLSCSFPIYTKVGGGGGIFVLDDFYLYKKYMTEKQRNVLEKAKEMMDIEDAKIIQNIIDMYCKK